MARLYFMSEEDFIAHCFGMERQVFRQLSHVYFALNTKTKLIKIGWSEAVDRRLRELNCQNEYSIKPLGIMEGDRLTESQLHERFAGYRQTGEWFKSSGELLGYIQSNTKPIEIAKRRKSKVIPIEQLPLFSEAA